MIPFPSKSHSQESGFPVDRSVNWTLRGLVPERGLAEKLASGGGHVTIISESPVTGMAETEYAEILPESLKFLGAAAGGTVTL